MAVVQRPILRWAQRAGALLLTFETEGAAPGQLPRLEVSADGRRVDLVGARAEVRGLVLFGGVRLLDPEGEPDGVARGSVHFRLEKLEPEHGAPVWWPRLTRAPSHADAPALVQNDWARWQPSPADEDADADEGGDEDVALHAF